MIRRSGFTRTAGQNHFFLIFFLVLLLFSVSFSALCYIAVTNLSPAPYPGSNLFLLENLSNSGYPFLLFETPHIAIVLFLSIVVATLAFAVSFTNIRRPVRFRSQNIIPELRFTESIFDEFKNTNKSEALINSLKNATKIYESQYIFYASAEPTGDWTSLWVSNTGTVFRKYPPQIENDDFLSIVNKMVSRRRETIIIKPESSAWSSIIGFAPEKDIIKSTVVLVPVYEKGLVTLIGFFGIQNHLNSDRLRLLRLFCEVIRNNVKLQKMESYTFDPKKSAGLLANHSDENMWIMSYPQKKLLYSSPSVEEILGYTPDQLKSLPVKDYLPQEAEEKLDKMIAIHTKETAKPSWHRVRQIKADGSSVWTEIKLVRIKKCYSGSLIITGITKDISKFTSLESQLYQAQKMEAIGILSSGIVHDFNNILAMMLGFTEIAKSKSAGNIQVEEYLEKVIKAGLRAKDLSKYILSAGKNKAPAKKPVFIGPIVNESVVFLKSSLPKNITLNHSIQAFGCSVLADTTQIHQIVMNLCINAMHAINQQQGEINLHLFSKAYNSTNNTHLGINLAPGRYAVLEVTDNGSGIRQEDMKKLFEPFFSTKQGNKGSGMGLTVIQGIVKNMGGEIIVRSEPEKGATFTIFFPVRHIDIQDEAETVKGAGKILLVDDEKNIATVTKQTLSSMGYDVNAYTNCQKALSQFSKEPNDFDLVLTDVTMPGMNGVEFSKQIKMINKKIPVILYTGIDAEYTSGLAVEANADAVISKPLSKMELSHSVGSFLADQP